MGPLTEAIKEAGGASAKEVKKICLNNKNYGKTNSANKKVHSRAFI